MKKSNLRIFSILSFLAVLVSGCDIFNADVKEYLEYYTETAGIEKMVFESSYPVDDEGYTSIDSSKDLKIHFYVRNPKNFDLSMNYIPPEGLDDTDGMKGLLNDLSDSGPITSLDGTNTEYVMTIKKEDLKEIDIKGDLSRIIDGNINVSRPIGDEFLSLGEFPLEKLRINSRPEKIRGAMFQLDGSKIDEEDLNDNSKYVVCFNVKKFDGSVHAKDTFDIYINGTFGGTKKTIKWQFDEDHSTLTKDSSTDTNDNIKLVIGYYNYLSSNSNKELLNLSGTTDEGSEYGTFYNTYVTGNTEYLNLFLLTDKHYQKNEECRYTITIKDNKGLSVSTTVLNTGYQLEKPSVSVSNGTETKTNTEINNIKISATPEIETLKVTFDHDGSNFYFNEVGDRVNGIKTPSKPYVNYVIKYGNDVYASGTERAPYSIDIPPSKNNQKYSFECYASCDGFVDSENMQPVAYLQVTRSNAYYVKQGANNEGADGSKRAPYPYIWQAVDAIESLAQNDRPTGDAYEIRLLSDIIAGDDDWHTEPGVNYIAYLGNNSASNNEYSLTLTGYNAVRKIDGCKNSQSIGHYHIIYICDSVKLTLKDVEITGGFTHDIDGEGAGVNVGGNSTLSVTGNVSVHDNYNWTNSNDGGASIHLSNVYLPVSEGAQKTILVGDLVQNKYGIGVRTKSEPTVSKPVVITGVNKDSNTQGAYGAYNSDEPYKYFKSDAGYQVGKKAVEEHNNNEEVILTPLGGGVSNYDQPKLNVKLDSNYFYPGIGRDITVTVFDPEQSGTGSPAGTDGKDITEDCENFDLSLSVAGYDYEGIKSNSRKIYIPSSLSPDNYELHVKFTYKNYPYDITVPLYGRLSIEGLQTAPTSGTYLCATKEGINKLSEWVANGNSLAGVTIELSDDITLDNSFVPIGLKSDNSYNAFCGTFDGKGHKISGINIEGTTDTVPYALFVSLGGNAKVKNLTAEGISPCAGLVGEVEGGANVEITNCVNKIVVDSSSTTFSTKKQTGGILGINNGTCIIDSCINDADLTSKKYIGGIIGFNKGSLTVRNCISGGDFLELSINAPRVGGILGQSSSTECVIENCYVNAVIKEVESNAPDKDEGGGIVGMVEKNNLILRNNFANTSDCNQGLIRNNTNYGIYDYNYYTASQSTNVKESTSYPKDTNLGNAQYKAEKNISNNYILDGSDPVKIGSFPKTNDVIDLLNYWVDSQSDPSQYKHWVNNNGTVTLED